MQAKPERRFFVIWYWTRDRVPANALRSFTVDTPHGGPHASRAEAESARVVFCGKRSAVQRHRGARWWQKHTRVVGYTLEELALAELAKVE